MSGLAGRARAFARRVAPNALAAVYVFRTLRRQARSFAEAGRDERPPAELARAAADGALVEIPRVEAVELALATGPLTALQKPDELFGLLERVRAARPSCVLEIGTAGGGTLYLLTRAAAADALVVSIDLRVPYFLQAARARMGRPGQRVVSIEGHSKDTAVRARVEALLADRPLDVLFVDGDHSYDGVRGDFELYAPLVRRGGLIALHDIVPDDVAGPAVSGDVPRFWRELKERYETEEIVSRDSRSGYGIGIVVP
ncbi:MAG: class I SAM-dependent methyltransferase [Actinomycetota bacterium]